MWFLLSCLYNEVSLTWVRQLFVIIWFLLSVMSIFFKRRELQQILIMFAHERGWGCLLILWNLIGLFMGLPSFISGFPLFLVDVGSSVMHNMRFLTTVLLCVTRVGGYGGGGGLWFVCVWEGWGGGVCRGWWWWWYECVLNNCIIFF